MGAVHMATSIITIDRLKRLIGTSRFFTLRTFVYGVPILAVLAWPIPAMAQDRTEIVNKSNQPWTLALVEGAKPASGTMKLMDKFSGKTLATLSNVGDAAALPPRSHGLLVFNRNGGYMFRDFILKDSQGYYAEYVASVEYLSSRKITIQLVDHHVGPPMDQTDDETIKQYLADGIEVGNENIIIHFNSLGTTQPNAQTASISQKINTHVTPTL